MSYPAIAEGEPIELVMDMFIPAYRRRWRENDGPVNSIPAGRYVVERVNPSYLLLAAADWDDEARITFHSTDHYYEIKGPREVEAFRKSLEPQGPLDWVPDKPAGIRKQLKSRWGSPRQRRL
jgi:hypothetical protein